MVRHVASRTNLVLEIRLSEPGLRVAVVDVSATPPTMTVTSGPTAGGHGLQLVAAVADRWGSESHAGGKRVWFELRRVVPR